MLLQDMLKEIMEYKPHTGKFYWKRPPANSPIKKGDEVGYKDGNYIRVGIGGKYHRLHRLAFLYMTGNIPDEVDHINHDTLDNRWENLRAVTHKENGKNQSKHSDNTSGTTGVSFYKNQGKWYSKIYVDGEHVYLGCSEDKEEAIRLRKEGEKLYGFHENHGLD